MMIREPKTVVVTPVDLWFIQKTLPFNAMMLDPRTGQSMFPMTPRRYGNGEVVSMHTAWKLRDKVNRILLRMADEATDQDLLPLDYDECWYLDMVLAADSYTGDMADAAGLKGSKRLLIGIFRVIYEHEMMIGLTDGVQGTEVDPPFQIDMLTQYLAQAEDKTWRPNRGPQDPEEGGVR